MFREEYRCVQERLRLVALRYYAGVPENLGADRTLRRYARESARHRLEEADREPFALGRQNKNVRGPEETLNAIAAPRERDRVIKSRRPYLRLQLVLARVRRPAGASDHQQTSTPSNGL